MAPIEVVIVSAPACDLCRHAQDVLHEVGPYHPVRVRTVAVDSAEGRRLVTAHRPAMFPLVLIDGERFSVGRLSRGKLTKLLDSKAA